MNTTPNTHLDLFGGETNIVDQTLRSDYKIFKVINNYRKSTGIDKCKNCKHSYYKQYSKKYYKCALLGCSAGPATDIRANNICDLWQQDAP